MSATKLAKKYYPMPGSCASQTRSRGKILRRLLKNDHLANARHENRLPSSARVRKRASGESIFALRASSTC